MASTKPWTEGERESCVDIEAERAYWMQHRHRLPNFHLFKDEELAAAISLGLEALLRHSRPGTIQAQLKVCYGRLTGASLPGWESVLEVAEHVYSHAAGQKAPLAVDVAWPWGTSRPSLRQGLV